jgi:hypothetical protein
MRSLARLGAWALLLAGLAAVRQGRQRAPNTCGMSRMRPIFERTQGDAAQTCGQLWTERSSLARYNLYRYREWGADGHEETPEGPLVLFLPGSLGSYQQVRSLGGRLADKPFGNAEVYAADFGEELSVLSGRVVREQACFAVQSVRALAQRGGEVRRPVLLVGHSMGGVVARMAAEALAAEGWEGVDVVTIGTPHARPPIEADRGMAEVYAEMGAERHRARWALLSIGTGARDGQVSVAATVVAREATRAWVPSAQIGGVGVEVDHNAAVWCSQLVQVLRNAVYASWGARGGAASARLAAMLGAMRVQAEGDAGAWSTLDPGWLPWAANLADTVFLTVAPQLPLGVLVAVLLSHAASAWEVVGVLAGHALVAAWQGAWARGAHELLPAPVLLWGAVLLGTVVCDAAEVVWTSVLRPWTALLFCGSSGESIARACVLLGVAWNLAVHSGVLPFSSPSLWRGAAGVAVALLQAAWMAPRVGASWPIALALSATPALLACDNIATAASLVGTALWLRRNRSEDDDAQGATIAPPHALLSPALSILALCSPGFGQWNPFLALGVSAIFALRRHSDSLSPPKRE